MMPQADRQCDSGGSSLETGSKLALSNPDTRKRVTDRRTGLSAAWLLGSVCQAGVKLVIRIR